MTRKDYELLAHAIAQVRSKIAMEYHLKLNRLFAQSIVDDVARSIARELVRDNPRFDVDRFLQAIIAEPTKK
jgi:hypothetical protein